MPTGVYKHFHSYWKGKHLTNDAKEKLRLAHKGKKLTIEHRDKLVKSHMGKKMNKKTKKAILKAISGKNNWQWKGGRSRGYRLGYYSLKYKLWRKAIFERDNFTCQICRKVGVYLTAHHIKSFAYYPKLRFEINNGITLCEDCHKLTDNYKGRAKLKK